MVVAVAELLEVFGSEVPEVTEAVLVRVPAAVGVTSIVTVAVAPEARSPKEHFTVRLFERSGSPVPLGSRRGLIGPDTTEAVFVTVRPA